MSVAPAFVVPGESRPAAWTPLFPPGIDTVTWVPGFQPRVGRNVIVSPETDQVPLILGATAGIGVDAATASLNLILIGAAPLASLPPSAGVTETTCSGASGLAGLEIGRASCRERVW